MRIILDFETTFTVGAKPPHGLRDQTVPEYLHDPRTFCLGAAVSVDGSSHWVPPDDLESYLDKIANCVQRGAVLSAHNATFDLSVWARFYPDSYARVRAALIKDGTKLVDTEHLARWLSAQGVLPYQVRSSVASLGDYYGIAKGDTAQAVAAGGEALATYALRDVEIQYKVLELWYKWTPEENKLSTLHVLCGTPDDHALALNAEILEPLTRVTPNEQALNQAVRKDISFIAALERLGVAVQYKTTKTGRNKPALAKTDDFMHILAQHPNPQVRRLRQARLNAASNIERTRAQTFLRATADGSRALPLPLRYYAAHTGRSGGSDKMNVQNLPRGGAHRRALMAPQGHVLVGCDASQIEVRVLAWLAHDEPTLAAFRDGRDPYKAFAVDLYQLDDETQVTAEQRRVSKSAVLGLGFGAGAQGFINYCKIMGIDIDPFEAKRVVNTYRRTRAAVPQYWHRVEQEVRKHGEILLPSGRKMVYPEMTRDTFTRPAPFTKVKGEVSKLWHGLLTENVVQACARDVTLLYHAVEIGRRYPVVMLVHDEVVCSVLTEQAQECLDFMLEIMATPPTWAADLPLAAEGDIGTNYGDLK